MLRFLRKRRASPALPMDPIEVDGVVYAVGDIHGRHDLLLKLLDKVFESAAELDTRPKLVFVGDYIDRGEGARETVELLMEIANWPEVDAVFLMGNHEQMLLRFLRDPETGVHWLRFGGLQTLMSYGVGGAANLRADGAADRLRAELIEAMGPHLTFIEGLRLSHRVGNVLFTHAGADPALPAEEQDVNTLLWGCGSFLRSQRSDGLWVVHGHTVVQQPAAEQGRIAIDTGAYFSGRLTAARIANGAVAFLQT